MSFLWALPSVCPSPAAPFTPEVSQVGFLSASSPVNKGGCSELEQELLAQGLASAAQGEVLCLEKYRLRKGPHMAPWEKPLCPLSLTSVNTNSLHFPNALSRSALRQAPKWPGKHLSGCFLVPVACVSACPFLWFSLSAFLFFSGVPVRSVSHLFKKKMYFFY